MTFSSFLISQIFLDQATEQYGKLHQVGQEKMDRYRHCCDAFDYLIDSACSENCDFEVQVNENDLSVEVALTLPSTITVRGNTQDFGWIVE